MVSLKKSEKSSAASSSSSKKPSCDGTSRHSCASTSSSTSSPVTTGNSYHDVACSEPGRVRSGSSRSPNLSTRSDDLEQRVAWNRRDCSKAETRSKTKKKDKPKISKPIYIEPINGKEFKNSPPARKKKMSTQQSNISHDAERKTQLMGPESFSAFWQDEVFARSVLLAQHQANARKLGICNVRSRF